MKAQNKTVEFSHVYPEMARETWGLMLPENIGDVGDDITSLNISGLTGNV
jgi:hypothetical protein